MERRYQLALERIEELEEKYIDLKAEHMLMRSDYREILKRNLELVEELEKAKEEIREMREF